MRNRIRKIRLHNTNGPWPIGSELLVQGEVYLVREYERAKDGHWVVLQSVGDPIPLFWRVAAVRRLVKAKK